MWCARKKEKNRWSICIYRSRTSPSSSLLNQASTTSRQYSSRHLFVRAQPIRQPRNIVLTGRFDVSLSTKHQALSHHQLFFRHNHRQRRISRSPTFNSSLAIKALDRNHSWFSHKASSGKGGMATLNSKYIYGIVVSLAIQSSAFDESINPNADTSQPTTANTTHDSLARRDGNHSKDSDEIQLIL